MEVVKKYFPSTLPDNEIEYFSMLEGVIESVDELAKLQISKLTDSYAFRISTSVPLYNEMLIQELIKFHNMFHIRIDMSKSIKSSGTIMFKIKV